MRVYQVAEPIEFYGHSGKCRYCIGGIVKMRRSRVDLSLQPDRCYCLQCGQSYYVKIEGDIVAWEQQQWQQKYDADTKQTRVH